LPIIMLSGPGDESLIGAITMDNLDHRIKTLIPEETDVAAAIIKKAAVCVCNDSAPMHLAAAVGTPSVALFGPVSPNRSAPSLEEGCSVLYEGMFCSPCTLYYSRSRCRRGLNFCMFAIEPSQVIEHIANLLSPSESC
jgi:ADP-heptose:LPS heptosyltransferase